MLSTLILSELSYPAMHLAVQPAHHWSVHFGPLVLEAAPLKYPTPTTDRDQTVSRRFEPNSRTALIGEQPNPWDLLQPQVAMSLLSPEYLLSVERRRFHFQTAGSLSPTFVSARLAGLAVNLPYTFAL